MAFPMNVQQELNNRKILEDLQLKKQLLQKTTVGGTTISNIQQYGQPVTHSLSAPVTEVPLNSSARAALNIANSQSFAYFIPTDSVFGNNIIPVLPRFDNTSTK